MGGVTFDVGLQKVSQGVRKKFHWDNKKVAHNYLTIILTIKLLVKKLQCLWWYQINAVQNVRRNDYGTALLYMIIPRRPGMIFHNCAHGHRGQCQPCTSAKVFGGPPYPLVPQMILLAHKSPQKNNLVLYVQERLAMVVFVCQLMRGSSQ